LTPSDSVLIYPNPVSVNEFYIDFGWINFQQAKIELIDCKGKVLFELRTESTSPIVTISTVNLLHGIYILRIYVNNTIINRKILIHKN